MKPEQGQHKKKTHRSQKPRNGPVSLNEQTAHWIEMKSWELRKQTTKTTERRVTELTEHMKEFGVVHKSLMHLLPYLLMTQRCPIFFLLLKRFAEQAKY